MPTTREYHNEYREIKDKTEASKLRDLSLQELQAHWERLSEIEPYLLGVTQAQCKDRIQSLRQEIELRRIEEKADQRHKEAFGVGKKGLTWARVAGVAAIAAGLIAAGELIHNIF